ncbi:FG-GAP repeat protein [Botrimarina colliarenosi]|uniref:FG-GAP repeat protein n=1 Tax=Botrimarina colliarenosi TaxID=2528001 RepID=A0A5C5ZW44_9BACT|nr:CRTAC1 family protein [Botrimarina colliarenosi]TWT91804.1 FG-GAP repeat protein [Botrimarina colliarenosi]
MSKSNRRTARRLLAGLLGMVGSQPCCAVQFADVTMSAGLTHTQWDLPATDTDAIQHMAGGAAAADFDGDGWVDLFFTRIDAPDVLYRNLGGGVFEDVSTAAGFTHAMNTNGAVWGDIDNDGDADLYVTTLLDATFRNHLYINDGLGGFSEEAVTRGADLTDAQFVNGFSATLGDYDSDGYLDLYTTEWGTGFGAGNSRLLRNLGANAPGHFVDQTVAAGVDVSVGHPASQSFAFAPSIVDVDRDGHADLVVAGDFGGSRLFWNNGDGTFKDGTVSAGVGTDENGMGSALGDYDGDGDLDWFVSSIYEEGGACGGLPVCGWGDSGNRLFSNNGDRTFTDATDTTGVRQGGWGWGSAFLDYDNDGDLDLTHTNGVDFPFESRDAPFVNDPTRFWENNDGAFTDVATQVGVNDADQGKGLLTLDYDRDGDLDLLIVNNAGLPILYENQGGNQNDWVRVRATGTVSNADGIGAQVTVIRDESDPEDLLYHEINAGSHYLGQSEAIAHFGLGDHPEAIDLIVIEWPASGAVQVLRDRSPNFLFSVVEPLPGDFNADGNIDAADYAVWRDGLGSIFDYGHYATWRSHYGSRSTLPPATGNAVVPEPTTLLLVCLVLSFHRASSRAFTHELTIDSPCTNS